MPSRSNLRFSNCTLMGWSSTTRMEGAAIGQEENELAQPEQVSWRRAVLAVSSEAMSLHGVFHQERHGHGPNSAGHRRDETRDWRNRWKMNISGESIAGFFRKIHNAVDADINYD